MLRDSGVREIHMRISSSPVKFPCYYGIDTPSGEELIASRLSVEEIGKFIGCDSLSYLSHKGMVSATNLDNYCDACFSGKYPI
jgi:amidophosphoribosyltransferase